MWTRTFSQKNGYFSNSFSDPCLHSVEISWFFYHWNQGSRKVAKCPHFVTGNYRILLPWFCCKISVKSTFSLMIYTVNQFDEKILKWGIHNYWNSHTELWREFLVFAHCAHSMWNNKQFTNIIYVKSICSLLITDYY